MLQTINRRSCTITEKAPTKAFFWLKTLTRASASAIIELNLAQSDSRLIVAAVRGGGAAARAGARHPQRVAAQPAERQLQPPAGDGRRDAALPPALPAHVPPHVQTAQEGPWGAGQGGMKTLE